MATMIESPRVETNEAQATAVVRIEVPRAEIQKVMEPAITEVLQVLRAQGVQPAGPLFSYHHRMDPAVFDFEVGFPVSRTVRPSGRVVASRLPAATVARAVYRGPYEGLGSGWHELTEWMKREGHEAGPDLWERYVAGPESGEDASKWRTELNRPLVEGD
jgi:effector-binding domain-containing protein